MTEKCMEKRLIEHCAPTLAGMKSASLFNYFHKGEQIVREELREINDLLNDKGVYADVLIWREKSALIYLYRVKMLEKELKQPGVLELLERYGYENSDIDSCMKHLKYRLLKCTCFPHEIGVFLGYPLEDVKGFIDNKGKNCESCGVWKVYCDREEKDKLFQKFKKCKDVYLQVFYEGRELSKMTVCT